MNLAYIRRELKNYKRMHLSEEIEEKECIYSEIKKRKLKVIQGTEFDYRDRIFFIHINDNIKILGLKILIDYFEKQGNESIDMDSKLKADMLLGIFYDLNIENGTVTVSYYPYESGEKKYIFNQIKKNTDIEVTFPMVLEQSTKEMIKWEEVWAQRAQEKTEEELVEFLYNTEPHLRKYTEEVIRKNKKVKFKIYDPACSTGDFLAYIKEKFSEAYTIGHDMDENMIKIASAKVDESRCCNAFDSDIPAECIDVIALRFLNYAVVNGVEAEKLFQRLIGTLKKDGLAVCFGHTPVLLDAKKFEQFGMKVIGKIGYDQLSDSIFQFYVLKFS